MTALTRLRQRGTKPVASTPVVPTSFSRMKSARMVLNPTSSPTPSELAYLSHCYFSSTQVYPLFGTNPLTGNLLLVNNIIANTHAINPNTKFGVYAISVDFPTAQWGFVTSYTRSGTTLTLTSRDMKGVNTRAWTAAGYSAGNDVCIQGFTGADAVWNGTIAGSRVTVSGATMTITGVATSGGASGSDINVFVAPSGAGAFYGLMQQCDNPDFWLRKYGPTTQSNRIHAWVETFFTPTMNVSTYVGNSPTSGKKYQRIVAEYYSTNLLNYIGAGTGAANDGIQWIMWDNTFDKYKDVVNDKMPDGVTDRFFGGNQGSAFKDFANVTLSSTWQDITILFQDTAGSDATAINAYRDGQGAVFNWLDAAPRTKSVGPIEHIGNHDTASGTQILPGNYNQIMDGILLENVVGGVADTTRGASTTQFSLFNTSSTLYNTSNTGILQVAPGRLRGNKVVIIGAEPTTYTQYETIRYINALAAICDGNIEVAINAGSGTWQVYPEQKAGRGTAIDPVPLSNYSGNTSGTVLKRVFQNMMVLINISNVSSSSMNFTGQGWFAIDSTVDSTVNNGAALTTVTLPAWTARFYVKQQNAGAY